MSAGDINTRGQKGNNHPYQFKVLKLLAGILEAVSVGGDGATETTLSDLNSKFNTLGQKASDNSHPVVLSTEQEALLNQLRQLTDIIAVSAQNVDDIDNVTIVSNLLNKVGGRAVRANTYAPGYSVNDAAIFAFDFTTGGLLVQQNNQEAAVATRSIASTDTSFVNSTFIDLRSYSAISIIPNVTTFAGTVGQYKIQWSFDNTNWFDETIDEPGASSGGESVVSQDVMIREYDSTSNGFKTTSGVILTKKARYIRFAQRSDAPATNLTAVYNYQLFV